MSATRPARGRPRRTEAVKRVKLRQSTFLLWNQRKESLGLKGASYGEFAEMFAVAPERWENWRRNS